MYRQHFGLKAAPLDKATCDLWDDGALAHLEERFQWLLQSPGIGLLTGEPGVGKMSVITQFDGPVFMLSDGRKAITRFEQEVPFFHRVRWPSSQKGASGSS
jgi:hypothetical protein